MCVNWVSMSSEPVYNTNLHLYNLHPLIISRSKWSKETGSVLNMHARHTHINSHTYCFEALHLTQVPLTSLLGHQWSELSGPASKTAEEISTQSALIHRQSQNSNTTSWSICSSRMSQGKEFTAAVYKPNGKEKTSLCELGAGI